MFIQVENTPNPAVLKFIPPEFQMEKNFYFETMDEARKKSPLALALFQIDGIISVFFSDGFISVGKSERFDWSLLKPIIINIILDFVNQDRTIIFPDNKEEDENDNDSIETLKKKYDLYDDKNCEEIIEQIKEILDDRVKPGVHQDGGDIIYIAFTKGVVYMKLEGACSGCPSSSVTLRSGIKNILQYYIPEVLNVMDITEVQLEEQGNS